MKFFEKFSLTKLCAALQRKDWKEVERQQNKLGLEQFLARRGIGSRKPVAILRPSIFFYFLIISPKTEPMIGAINGFNNNPNKAPPF